MKATKLKNMDLTSVDLVRVGANQEARILMFKSAVDGSPQEQLRVYVDVLCRSLRTIERDESLTTDERKRLAERSMMEYLDAVDELLFDTVVEATTAGRYDTLKEV